MRAIMVTVALAFSALMLGGSSTAQAPEPVSAPLEFTDVVQVPGVSADDLYVRASTWFMKAFVDSKNVLEVQDKAAGVLGGKGSIPYEPNVFMSSALLRGHITFTIQVMVKEGRYKYDLSDFQHHGSPSNVAGPIDFGELTTAQECPQIKGTTKGMREKVWPHLKEVANARATALITSLKDAMAKPIGGEKNW